MIELLPPDQQRAARDLMMSPTMDRLLALAQGDPPLDWTTAEGLKAGFCTAGLDMIRALDAGRIRFDNDHDRAMFHAMLLVAMQFVFDGRFAQGAGVARAN